LPIASMKATRSLQHGNKKKKKEVRYYDVIVMNDIRIIIST